MASNLALAGSLIGGLGLFLLAVGLITDGLQIAAGNSLRALLARSTSSPGRGIASGMAITALVQSSSAVTVATIGFVNAGLLTLPQALGVVYGSNIGTTMTGWLVAAVGFKWNVEAVALPLIGFGMLMRLTGAGTRRGALGMALAGFGLFFVGVDVLRTSFEGLAKVIDIERLHGEGIGGTLLFVAVGFVMTVLTQSSSAAIAITLTAASGGALPLAAAAATVIGANVGTTSTAMLATIGATPNAKRVAAAHVAFNLGTAVVALVLLPGMLWSVEHAGRLLGLQDAPAVSLALFHTIFNVIGVLLMWPLSARLARFLQARFRRAEDLAGEPRYLDPTVAVTPSLALNALVLETARVGEIARGMAAAALSAETDVSRALDVEAKIVDDLLGATGGFMTRMQRRQLSADVAHTLPEVVRTGQHFSALAEAAADYARARSAHAPLDIAPIAESWRGMHQDLAELLARADPQSATYGVDECNERLAALQARYQEIRGALIGAGSSGMLTVEAMSHHLDQVRRVRRMARQALKGAQGLADLLAATAAPSTEPLENGVRPLS